MPPPGVLAPDPTLADDIARLLALAGEEKLPPETEPLPAGWEEKPLFNEDWTMVVTSPVSKKSRKTRLPWSYKQPTAPAIMKMARDEAAPAAASSTAASTIAFLVQLQAFFAVIGVSVVGLILMASSSLLLLPKSDEYLYVPPTVGAAYGSLRRIDGGLTAATQAVSDRAPTAHASATEAASAATAATADSRERNGAVGRGGGSVPMEVAALFGASTAPAEAMAVPAAALAVPVAVDAPVSAPDAVSAPMMVEPPVAVEAPPTATPSAADGASQSGRGKSGGGGRGKKAGVG
ncbi:hypothetical protein Ctob_007359 [Chrysochromulina tobinii]|uniref:Uncharacterized protein n=1 Tax=Chrysochromulina tobinii TaxID=1460289 RepID=A0A0M0JIA1_9EUKA|nr:hypothetical protein Ctob_007359 [Chrysochromulina tobinii]|eukprot:KOO26052.1 hypothetical protein Ctob_007359 [Chrysochromulina sp. CCMP291]